MGKNDRLWHSTENRSSSFLEVVVDRSPSVDSHTQKTTETQRIVLKIASQSRQDLAKALCVTIQHESLPEVRTDLAREITGSVGEIKDAALQVKGMVKRLTPLWAGIIAAGGLIAGIVLMYFVMGSWQRKIEEKIDHLQQAQPLQVQPQALPSSPTAGLGSGHQKTHGVPKPKPKQNEPAPAPAATEQP
jgi:hypothetical protein